MPSIARTSELPRPWPLSAAAFLRVDQPGSGRPGHSREPSLRVQRKPLPDAPEAVAFDRFGMGETGFDPGFHHWYGGRAAGGEHLVDLVGAEPAHPDGFRDAGEDPLQVVADRRGEVRRRYRDRQALFNRIEPACGGAGRGQSDFRLLDAHQNGVTQSRLQHSQQAVDQARFAGQLLELADMVMIRWVYRK